MYKRFFCAIILFSTIIFNFNCKKSSSSPENNNNFPEITGEYLGQEPPGTTPERFPPPALQANDVWFWHGPLAFSPDGTELYFTKYIEENHTVILSYTKIENGKWTEPQAVSFNGNYDGNNPFFSPDGNKLYYISSRTDGFIFEVTRNGSGWSIPRRVDIPIPGNMGTGWQFSMANNGTLYFELWQNNDLDLYFSRFEDGNYSIPEEIGAAINTGSNEFSPFIDPDEEYIIFNSNRPGSYGMHDLYVSFRNPDSTWTDPVNMGPAINSSTEDVAPYISPDGNYLFFFTARQGDIGYNPYWVSTQIIEDLKPAELK
ncbi:hypothetical protein ACFL4T_05235 [candidate division KSB1 bacterium]